MGRYGKPSTGETWEDCEPKVSLGCIVRLYLRVTEVISGSLAVTSSFTDF